MKDFWNGFVKGCKETPRGFFAPAIIAARGLTWIYHSVLVEKDQTDPR